MEEKHKNLKKKTPRNRTGSEVNIKWKKVCEIFMTAHQTLIILNE